MSFRQKNPEYIRKIELLASRYCWVKLMDSIPQTELIKLLSINDIFAMPSVPETFGLVYVEAMTQGLPIIYAKGEGFEGFYKDGEIGYGVDADSITDISDKIELLIKSYNRFAINVVEPSSILYLFKV